jgi:hypothetical protein
MDGRCRGAADTREARGRIAAAGEHDRNCGTCAINHSHSIKAFVRDTEGS